MQRPHAAQGRAVGRPAREAQLVRATFAAYEPDDDFSPAHWRQRTPEQWGADEYGEGGGPWRESPAALGTRRWQGPLWDDYEHSEASAAEHHADSGRRQAAPDHPLRFVAPRLALAVAAGTAFTRVDVGSVLSLTAALAPLLFGAPAGRPAWVLLFGLPVAALVWLLSCAFLTAPQPYCAMLSGCGLTLRWMTPIGIPELATIVALCWLWHSVRKRTAAAATAAIAALVAAVAAVANPEYRRDYEHPRVDTGGRGAFRAVTQGAGWCRTIRQLLAQLPPFALPALATAGLPCPATVPFLLIFMVRLPMLFAEGLQSPHYARPHRFMNRALRLWSTLVLVAHFALAAAGPTPPRSDPCGWLGGSALRWCNAAGPGHGSWWLTAAGYAFGVPWCGDPSLAPLAVGWYLCLCACAAGFAGAWWSGMDSTWHQSLSLSTLLHVSLFSCTAYVLWCPGWSGLVLLAATFLAVNTKGRTSSDQGQHQSPVLDNAALLTHLLVSIAALLLWFGAAAASSVADAMDGSGGSGSGDTHGGHERLWNSVGGAALMCICVLAAAAGHLHSQEGELNDPIAKAGTALLNKLPRSTAKMATLLLLIAGSAYFADLAHLVLLLGGLWLYRTDSDDAVRHHWRWLLYAMEVAAVWLYYDNFVHGTVPLVKVPFPITFGIEWGLMSSSDAPQEHSPAPAEDPWSVGHLVLCVSLSVVQSKRFEDGEWWTCTTWKMPASACTVLGCTLLMVAVCITPGQPSPVSLLGIGVVAVLAWMFAGIRPGRRSFVAWGSAGLTTLIAVCLYLCRFHLPGPLSGWAEAVTSIASDSSAGASPAQIAGMGAWLAAALLFAFLASRGDVGAKPLLLPRSALNRTGGTVMRFVPAPVSNPKLGQVHVAAVAAADAGCGLRSGMRILRVNRRAVRCAADVETALDAPVFNVKAASDDDESAQADQEEMEPLMAAAATVSLEVIGPPACVSSYSSLLASLFAPGALLIAGMLGPWLEGPSAVQAGDCDFDSAAERAAAVAGSEAGTGLVYFVLGILTAWWRMRALVPSAHPTRTMVSFPTHTKRLIADGVDDATPVHARLCAAVAATLALGSVFTSLPDVQAWLHQGPLRQYAAVDAHASGSPRLWRELFCHLLVLTASAAERWGCQYGARFPAGARACGTAAGWLLLLLMLFSVYLCFDARPAWAWAAGQWLLLLVLVGVGIPSLVRHCCIPTAVMILAGIFGTWQYWVVNCPGGCCAGHDWQKFVPTRHMLVVNYFVVYAAAVAAGASGAVRGPDLDEGDQWGDGFTWRLQENASEVLQARNLRGAAAGVELRLLLLHPPVPEWLQLRSTSAAPCSGLYVRHGEANEHPSWQAVGERRYLVHSPVSERWTVSDSPSGQGGIVYAESAVCSCRQLPHRVKCWVPEDITVQAEIVPQSLLVSEAGGCSGQYTRLADEFRNGMPVWRQDNGTFPYIALTAQGFWIASGSLSSVQEKPQPPGSMISAGPHRGLMPQHVGAWAPAPYAPRGPSISVHDSVAVRELRVCAVKREGAFQPVTVDPELLGWYVLLPGQWHNGMPVWAKAGCSEVRLYSQGQWWYVSSGDDDCSSRHTSEAWQPPPHPRGMRALMHRGWLPDETVGWQFCSGGLWSPAPEVCVERANRHPVLVEREDPGERAEGPPKAKEGMRVRITPPGKRPEWKANGTILDIFDEEDACRVAVVHLEGVGKVEIPQPYWDDIAFSTAQCGVCGGTGRVTRCLMWNTECSHCNECSYRPETLLTTGAGPLCDGEYELAREITANSQPVWARVSSERLPAEEAREGMTVVIRESALSSRLPAEYVKGQEDPRFVIRSVTEDDILIEMKGLGVIPVRYSQWDNRDSFPRKVVFLTSTVGGYWQLTDYPHRSVRGAQLCSTRSHPCDAPHMVDEWEPEPYTAWDEKITVTNADDPTQRWTVWKLHQLLIEPYGYLVLVLVDGMRGGDTPPIVSLLSGLRILAALAMLPVTEELSWHGNYYWRWLTALYGGMVTLWLTTRILSDQGSDNSECVGWQMNVGLCHSPADVAWALVILALCVTRGQSLDAPGYAWVLLYKHKYESTSRQNGLSVLRRRRSELQAAHREYDSRLTERRRCFSSSGAERSFTGVPHSAVRVLDPRRPSTPDPGASHSAGHLRASVNFNADGSRSPTLTPVWGTGAYSPPWGEPEAEHGPGSVGALAAAVAAAAVAAAEFDFSPPSALESVCIMLLQQTYKPEALHGLRIMLRRHTWQHAMLRIARRLLFSWIGEITYLVICLHLLDSPCVTTAVPALGVLLYAIASNPRPVYAFWTAALIYYGSLICLKAALLGGAGASAWQDAETGGFALALLGWRVRFLSTVAARPELYSMPLLCFGAWEIGVFALIVFHRQTLQYFWGIATDTEVRRAEEYEEEQQAEHTVSAARQPMYSPLIERSNFFSDFRPNELRRSLLRRRGAVSRPPAHVCWGEQYLLEWALGRPVARFLRNLLNERHKRGGPSAYSLMCAADLVGFLAFLCATIASYRSPLAAGGMYPGRMCAVLVWFFAVTVLDRVIWVHRALVAKLVMQFVLTFTYLVVYVWLCLYANADTGSPYRAATVSAAAEPPSYWVQGLMATRVGYLALSALQLKLGYNPLSRTSRFPTGRVVVFWGLALRVYYHTPFLHELRALVDWGCTTTGLHLRHWLRLEAIIREALVVRCEREADRGERRGELPGVAKCTSFACCFLLIFAAIFGPLAWYSALSPLPATAPVERASFRVDALVGQQDWDAVPRAYELYRQDFELAPPEDLARKGLSPFLPPDWGELLERSHADYIGYGVAGARALQLLSFDAESEQSWTPSAFTQHQIYSAGVAGAAGETGAVRIQFRLTARQGADGEGPSRLSHTVLLGRSQLKALAAQVSPTRAARGVVQPPPVMVPFGPLVRMGHSGSAFVGFPSQGPAENASVACQLSLTDGEPRAWDVRCSTLFRGGNPPAQAPPGRLPSEILNCSQDCARTGQHWANAQGPYVLAYGSALPASAVLLPSVALAAAYACFVLVLHRLVRSAVGGTVRTSLIAGVGPADVEAHADAIEQARAEGDLVAERALYDDLVGMLGVPLPMGAAEEAGRSGDELHTASPFNQTRSTNPTVQLLQVPGARSRLHARLPRTQA